MAHNTILSPIYHQVERIESDNSGQEEDTHIDARDRCRVPDLLLRMFEGELSAADYGTVLTDGSDAGNWRTANEVLASLIRLEGDSAVFLEGADR